MRAKKSLGQHFLKSERALDAIIEAGEIKEGETVLEIGPGTGALTEKLLGARCLVLAVEKDDTLFEQLGRKFSNEVQKNQLNLIHEDILNFEFGSYNLAPRTYKLIANIPYNITGAILERFLSAENQPSKMVLLVQKEVAKRIVDEKGSILSVSVRAYGNPRYVETVKAGSFAPAPRVDSAIIAVENISKSFFNSFSEQFFFKVVRAGFKSKRKKLISNLSELENKQKLEEIFTKLGFDTNIRAEELKIGDWQALTAALT